MFAHKFLLLTQYTEDYTAEDASFEKDDESCCVTEINLFLFNLSSESSYKFAYGNEDPAGWRLATDKLFLK